jgi:serine-type anaerobic sulfatase-maturating enzyme
MSFEVMSRMIAAALRDPQHNAVDFIWHGGETTVLPQRFYEKALVVQSKFRRPGQVVRNLIQTNGTRLTPDWVRFFRANQFSVGISLDGPPEVHDQYRRYASGRPSFPDVARGIDLLREHDVPVSVLMVIDEGALELGPDRVFDFFVEYGITMFGLLAAKPTNQPDAQPGTPTDHYTDPSTMMAFLARIYDRWLEHGDPNIKVRELEGLRARIRGEQNGFCTLAGGCLGKYFLIEPNGDVAHCDLFLGDQRYTLGSVVTHDFSDFRSSEAILALQAENERKLDAMRPCPEFNVCNGWCPHERYTSIRHNLSHRDDCCGLRPLIEHIRARISEEPEGSTASRPLAVAT